METQPQLPDELALTALIKEEPVSGAWFRISIPMTLKASYSLLFGPAAAGRMTVTRNDLQSAIHKTRNLQIMDYVDLEHGWSGTLEIRALNRSDIANVLKAYEIWGRSGIYPPDTPAQLAGLDELLASNPDATILVKVTERGDGSATIKAIDQAVD